MTEPCDLCRNRSGVHEVGRMCCCLRLIREAPRGQHRKAMCAHLNRHLGEQRWQELRAAAQEEGLISARAAA